MKCSAAWCVSVVPNISPLHSLKLGKTLLTDSVLSCCNAAIDSARRISGPFNSLQWGLGAFRAELGWSVSLGTLLEGSGNARKFRDRRSLPPSALLPEDWTWSLIARILVIPKIFLKNPCTACTDRNARTFGTYFK